MALTSEEALAIEKFTLNVTIPIFIDDVPTPRFHATGTLFNINNRIFIVTAGHAFGNDFDLAEKLAYAETPLKGSFYSIGEFDLFKPKEDFIDVAVMEIKSLDTISKLKSGWKFLTLSNIAFPSKTLSDGAFFVAGYPAVLSQRNGDSLIGKYTTAYTQQIPVAPQEAEPPVIEELDLFFDYSHEASSITGERINTPKLHGVSGASIWELGSKKSLIWTPESVVHVVGVQSSFAHSKFIRAKSWLAVVKVLEQVDINIADEVRSKLYED